MENMKKLYLMLIALLAFSGFANAGVEVNKATQSDLEAISGLGPVKAKAIIDYRAKNGAFRTVEDLDRVKGIGESTLARIANDITIDGKAVKVSPRGADNKKMGVGMKKAEDKAAVAAPAAGPGEKKK